MKLIVGSVEIWSILSRDQIAINVGRIRKRCLHNRGEIILESRKDQRRFSQNLSSPWRDSLRILERLSQNPGEILFQFWRLSQNNENSLRILEKKSLESSTDSPTILNRFSQKDQRRFSQNGVERFSQNLGEVLQNLREILSKS